MESPVLQVSTAKGEMERTRKGIGRDTVIQTEELHAPPVKLTVWFRDCALTNFSALPQHFAKEVRISAVYRRQEGWLSHCSRKSVCRGHC